MSAVGIIMIAVVASLFAATVIVILILVTAGCVLDHLRARRDYREHRLEYEIDAQYRAARLAMNAAAGQSWRDVID